MSESVGNNVQGGGSVQNKLTAVKTGVQQVAQISPNDPRKRTNSVSM